MSGVPQITCLRIEIRHSIPYHQSMAGVRIRLATSDDCRALAEMRYRFRAETKSKIETKSLFLRRCTSWMKKRFRTGSSPWRCWVLDDGKRLLGHVSVQLFEKIPNPVNEPRARGTDAVILWATSGSKSLYRRCGFVEPGDIFELRIGANLRSEAPW